MGALHLQPLHSGRSMMVISAATKPQLTRRPAGVRKHHGQPENSEWRVQRSSRLRLCEPWDRHRPTLLKGTKYCSSSYLGSFKMTHGLSPGCLNSKTKGWKCESWSDFNILQLLRGQHLHGAQWRFIRRGLELHVSFPATTWNALGQRTVPFTFFSSKSRLQWEQIVTG